MGSDWSKVKNCCQTTTGEAWAYPTEDVSDTERCATYSESEGGDTKPIHDVPVVTVTPGEPIPGETKATQKNLSPVAKGDPTRRQSSVDSFQRLATADDLYDMEKLDSVASSNPGTDFNKLATRDLILPGIVLNSTNSVNEMLNLVEELRSQEEPDRRPKLQGSVSDSRSASIYLIHEEDLPASIRESDQEKSADNTHVSPPQNNDRPRTLSWENAVASKPPIVKRKFVSDSAMSASAQREIMEQEHDVLKQQVESFREGPEHTHTPEQSPPSSMDSEHAADLLAEVPETPGYGRRIRSTPIKIRIDSYDSDNMLEKDRKHQFEILKHRQEVEYWKSQKHKADMQMEKMSRMLAKLQARVDAISPDTKHLNGGGRDRRARRHVEDFDYSRSPDRSSSPNHHTPRKKRRNKKKRKERRFNQEDPEAKNGSRIPHKKRMPN